MTAVDRILDLMKEHHVTARDVAQATGIAASSFTEWKKGRSKPKTDALLALADYFQVSLDYLTGREVVATHKDDFGPLTEDERAELLRYLQFLRSRDQ